MRIEKTETTKALWGMTPFHHRLLRAMIQDSSARRWLKECGLEVKDENFLLTKRAARAIKKWKDENPGTDELSWKKLVQMVAVVDGVGNA